MRLDTEATICSIATGSVGALRGAIRISGPNALSIASKATQSSHRIEWNSKHAIRFETIVTLTTLGPIDVSVLVWPNERSYTGQPSVELHSLGNMIVLNALQSQLIENGSQLAQPGEFTLRAFLAGRLDLMQCEAVLGVIHASNSQSLQVALSQLAGGLSQPLQRLRTLLVHLLADIEAGLDFVDEDIEFISKSQVMNRIDDSIEIIARLLAQMESRASQSVELKIVLAGLPNAGKSSLANFLSKGQSSIVSHEPGTTRDYVRHRLEWDGMIVDLLDTAGLETFDATTPRGLAQTFTNEQIAQADLILYCEAANEASVANRDLPSLRPSNCPVWRVRTKCDLPKFDASERTEFEIRFDVSLNNLPSLRLLESAMRQWVVERRDLDTQVVPATADRCQASLSNASIALHQARTACEASLGDEIIASEIRLALEEIGLVAGTVYTDDILDALFSRFCIGK